MRRGGSLRLSALSICSSHREGGCPRLWRIRPDWLMVRRMNPARNILAVQRDTASLRRRSAPVDFSKGRKAPIFEITRINVVGFQRSFLLGPYPRFCTLQLVEQAAGTGIAAEAPLGRETSAFIHAVLVMEDRWIRGADVAV